MSLSQADSIGKSTEMPSTDTARPVRPRRRALDGDDTAEPRRSKRTKQNTQQNFSEYQFEHTGALARRHLLAPTRPPRPSAEGLRQLGITTPRNGKERRVHVRGEGACNSALRSGRQYGMTTIHSAGASSDDAGPASELDSPDCSDHNEDGDLDGHQYDFNCDLPSHIDDNRVSDIDADVVPDYENDGCASNGAPSDIAQNAGTSSDVDDDTAEMDQDADDTTSSTKAAEADWGNSLPVHPLPQHMFDDINKIADVCDNLNPEHRADLVRRAQKEMNDLRFIGCCLSCDTKQVLAKTHKLPLRKKPPNWLKLLECKSEYTFIGPEHRDYYKVTPPTGTAYITEWEDLVASPRAKITAAVAGKIGCEEDHIAICDKCRKTLKRKAMPKDATINTMYLSNPNCYPALRDLSKQERMLLNYGGRCFVGLQTYYMIPSGTEDESGTVITRAKL